jgi:hypothetical protein
MISDFMFYGTEVALLIAVAGLALERVAAWRGFPRRGLWAAALVPEVASRSHPRCRNGAREGESGLRIAFGAELG